MKQSNSSTFWASYADLMTALFIITLVLFVLSYKLFRDKEIAYQVQAEELRLRGLRLSEQEIYSDKIGNSLNIEKVRVDSLLQLLQQDRGRLAVLEEEYRKLKEIERAVSQLDPRYFEYQPRFKRHVLKTAVQFQSGRSQIQPQYENMLINAGQALKRLIANIDTLDDIKYALIIEGQASKDTYAKNYQLSYERALALKQLWEKNGIRFSPDKAEVLISGSGTGGAGRVATDEKLNQRFLIQIIPKVGTIDLPAVDLNKFEEENADVIN
jgi:outer membrane protein OmpA-like peptidoglycan-associated protein